MNFVLILFCIYLDDSMVCYLLFSVNVVDNCVHYQLLSNKLSQHLAAWNNKHSLSTFSVDQKSEWLSWYGSGSESSVVLQSRCPSQVRAAVIWKLGWGWRICFQDGALTWLLTGGLGSSDIHHVGLSMGLRECPHKRTANFPQGKWPKGEQGRICSIFMTPYKGVTKPIPDSQGMELSSTLEGRSIKRQKTNIFCNYHNYINWISKV